MAQAAAERLSSGAVKLNPRFFASCSTEKRTSRKRTFIFAAETSSSSEISDPIAGHSESNTITPPSNFQVKSNRFIAAMSRGIHVSSLTKPPHN
jgi:hypothetical protein